MTAMSTPLRAAIQQGMSNLIALLALSSTLSYLPTSPAAPLLLCTGPYGVDPDVLAVGNHRHLAFHFFLSHTATARE